MVSRVLVLQASTSSPQLERFVQSTMEAMSLTYPDLQWIDLGEARPNDHFYCHSWRLEQAPGTLVEHFADSAVPATWIEVQGEDEESASRVEGLLRPVLPVATREELLDQLAADRANASLLTRSALGHVGREVPQILRARIEDALNSEDLDMFTAACTAAAVLPSESYIPMIERRRQVNPALARLIDSTLAHLNAARTAH